MSDEVKNGAFQEMLDGALIREVEKVFMGPAITEPEQRQYEKLRRFGSTYGIGDKKLSDLAADWSSLELRVASSQGIQPGEFVTGLYGRGSGKTAIMQHWARRLYEQGRDHSNCGKEETRCPACALVKNPPGRPKMADRYLSVLSRTST